MWEVQLPWEARCRCLLIVSVTPSFLIHSCQSARHMSETISTLQTRPSTSCVSVSDHNWWHLKHRKSPAEPLFPAWNTFSYQTPLSMGYPRQEHWSGLPSPSQGDLPDPGIEPMSPALAARSVTNEALGKPGWARGKCLLNERATQ